MRFFCGTVQDFLKRIGPTSVRGNFLARFPRVRPFLEIYHGWVGQKNI